MSSSADSLSPAAGLEKLRSLIRLRHYSLRTERSCIAWVRRFLRFHRALPPGRLAGPEIASFLTHLAVYGRVSSATQNQALNALVFLYRKVLFLDLDAPCASSAPGAPSGSRPCSRKPRCGNCLPSCNRNPS